MRRAASSRRRRRAASSAPSGAAVQRRASAAGVGRVGTRHRGQRSTPTARTTGPRSRGSWRRRSPGPASRAAGRRRRPPATRPAAPTAAAMRARFRGQTRPGRDSAGWRPTAVAVELVQPGRRRGDAAVQLDLAVGGGQRDDPAAVLEVARQPAALHQHRAAVVEPQRRHDEEARAAVHLPVVEEDRVPRPTSGRPGARCGGAARRRRRRCAPAARQLSSGGRRLRSSSAACSASFCAARSSCHQPSRAVSSTAATAASATSHWRWRAPSVMPASRSPGCDNSPP